MKHISHLVVMLINKSVVFRTLGILKELKRSHYTNHTPVWLDLTSSKTTIERLPPLWSYDNRLFFACYWRIRLWEYVASTGRCHMPHNSSGYGFIARDISWPCNFSSWRCQLATKIMRFDTIRLFLWVYKKDRVYIDKSFTLEHLKTNFRQVMAEISPNMCQKSDFMM